MQKNTKNVWSAVLYIILFISLFIFIQSISLLGSGYVFNLLSGNGKVHSVIPNNSGECIAVSAVLSSFMTIVLFVAMRWAPVSRNYLKTRPWGVFVWAALLALGSILPTEYLVEKINLTRHHENDVRRSHEGLLGLCRHRSDGTDSRRDSLSWCHTAHAASGVRQALSLDSHRHFSFDLWFYSSQ